ncbi:DUF4902 domain-containing protein [Litoribacillus peritrichatus]|uniref:DUF4902 domain-containing protein n=1 Tax=Litoribacillus peritrichatus TaxID=718191 RepID=A0ABP7MR14_9GAMM
MNINTHQSSNPLLTLSQDGYIRVTQSVLKTIALKHLDSGIYDDPVAIHHNQNITCEVTGYTEWISETIPLLSIGWDWKLDYKKQSLAYVMTGNPYSNVIVQDNNFSDLDQYDSLNFLSDLINKIEWSSQISTLITKKYS